MFRSFCLVVLSVSCFVGNAASAAAERRMLAPADITAVREVSDPQLSPDGAWVAYTVRTANDTRDERIRHIWMASWDGTSNVQLTYGEHSADTPRWSPDGRYLAFLSARGAEDPPSQVWLLDRSGGEAQPLTNFEGEVLDFHWSPDGKQLALIVEDQVPQRAASDEDRTPPPIVIDRYYFKEDETGYLGSLRRHLYVFDIATRGAQIITPGRFDESLPAWSPDGRLIAFISNRSADPDRNNEYGLYLVEPRAGADAKLVTTFHGEAGDSDWMSGPVWRPDGGALAFITASDPKLIYYAAHRLAIVNVADGERRVLTSALDRNVLQPRWSADGRALFFLIEDDGNQHLARMNVATGKLERLLDGRRETSSYDLGPRGRIAVLDGTVDAPDEVFALERGARRALSRQNDAWAAGVQLATTEEIRFTSNDGTEVGGFLVKPPGFRPQERYPTLLWIHGGPVSQYANSFSAAWQIFAAHGYVVVGVNPRGSSGRGEAFASAIFADWGNKDSEDVLAAVDHVVERGVADPRRLGVGGWSYGGILTNFVIAKDGRFKAAASGASISNVFAGYGTDMYVREYELELGVPWKNLDLYLRNSYPFLHADRIRTPTLFVCGERDFNVPLLNSEQMYQALRSTGVDTQLVIYPEQYHGISKPSYLRDRMQRYLDWFGKYLGTNREQSTSRADR